MTELIFEPKPLSTMQPLNTLTFPLNGCSLIEASAGTGKTYTIVNLYLRLLLGHECQPLSVEQILVVTFTNAATAELRERIRQRLRSAYLDFFAQSSEDHFVQSLIEQSKNLEQDCQKLALASKQMDEAAVYTIHGFCQKALTEHAFESGALYDQSFILDESEWVQIAVEDYWRKHLVPLPSSTLQLVLKMWKSPDDLLKSIYSFIYRDVFVANSQTMEQCLQSISVYQECLEQSKNWWLSNKVSEQLAKANLNGRAKLSKLTFLKNIDEFCQSELMVLNKDIGAWSDLTPEKVQKAAKKGSADLSHLDFSRFETLDEALNKALNAIKVAFSQQAIQVIRANLNSHKQRLHMLSPDDLLSGLQKALLTGSNNNSDSNTNSNTDCTHANTNAQTLTLNDNNNALAAAIRQAYPAALIDEFQDTDPVQFDVFSEIYSNPTDLKQEFGQPHSKQQLNQNLCWIMIGDPKQAIYAFRGADIFTYIEAKKRIDPTRHFTLATNWRSAPKLVQAINHLFESSAKGFLFENNIPFYPVSAGKNVQGFEVQGQVIQSLHFEHYCDQNSPIVAASAAQPILAINMANQISKWLSLANQGQANINGKPVSAGDCCVLVRTRYEADIVKLALAEVNVDSVYLSRSSVFQTDIAKDLFRLLKAMSQPSEEKLLKTALMSELFSLNTEQLDELFNDELVWQNVLEQRFLWFQAWSKQGVMRALKLAFNFFNVEQELLANFKDGLRRITDLQHLVELLQQQSLQLVGESQLIHWFEASILEPDANSESQQMRLESDSNLVQIITLHASKGLEFPLVFIPFAADYKVSKDAIYHNQNEALEVDFLQQDTSLFKSEFERLAEDIRLLYVAVTRAVYYCQIGLWNNALGKNKKVSGFSQSAIGNILLSESEPADAEVNSTISNDHIAQRLMQLAQEHDVSYARFSEIPPLTKYVESNKQDLQQLSCLTLNSPVTRSWRLTSYSAISRQQIHLDVPSPGLDEGHDHDTNIETSPESNYLLSEEMNELVQSPFTFERGANAGSFLHGVLENLDFQNLDNMPEVIEKQSIKFSIDTSWFECLQTWLTDVIHAPISFLNKDNPHVSGNAKQLSLSALSSQQVKVEMEFYMPLHQVQVEDFNQVINGFYPQYHRHYQFDDLNGMIKGYIDLIFEFEGKFFVADYKSNHLGESFNAYDEVAMQHCMTEHDYHLQAILYTLALHRWLKNRLLDYEYSTHVGGAYYLFVRGMTTQQVSKTPCANGVYFMKPEQALIENLDRLFSGDASQISLNQHQDNNAETEQQGQLGLW